LLDDQEEAPDDEHKGVDEIVIKDRETTKRHSTLKKNHLVDTINRYLNRGVSTRSKIKVQMTILSQIEPKIVKEALVDESWLKP